MVYKLFDFGKTSGAIAIVFLLINSLDCSATEYVFTAPPEVERAVVEIPVSDTEYPLYECSNEATGAENEEDRVLDSHNCICTDCEDQLEDIELNQLNSNSETEVY